LVNIVVPHNSIPGTINLALTKKELEKEGKKVRHQYVDEKQRDGFWNNLSAYTDSNDRSLVILDMPHPEIERLKQIQLEPWKAVILYVPSELNAPNKEERDVMIEKGISVVPARKTYECFLGDISKDNEAWISLSKILSLEERSVDDKELAMAKGIIEQSVRSPREAIKCILADDFNYFQKIGARHKLHDLVFETFANEAYFIKAKQFSPKAFADAFEAHIKFYVDPIAIHGALKAIFTIKPTLFTQTPQLKESQFDFLARFGKGAIIGFESKKVDSETLAYFIGIGQRPMLLLKISPPKFVAAKTLRRRLVGGKTSQEIEGKKYEKKYHGLSDRFPRMSFLSDDVILVPEEAFEDTIALLHSSGTDYELLSTYNKH